MEDGQRMSGIRDVREVALLLLAGASTRTDILGSLRAARTWFQAGRADLEAERLRLLGDLLTDASSHVPYWRDLFARLGVKASDFRSVEDLRTLPTMDKATVRANEAAMTRSPVISRTAEIGSSGSTGEYATFLDTPADVLWERVNNLLAAEQAGFRTGDPSLLFGVSVPRKPLKRLKDLVTGATYVYAFDGSDEAMSRAAAAARARGVRMVAGYASSVFLLANYVRRHEPRLRFPKLRGCMTWGETLYPSWRATIEEVLGVPVVNTYGAAGETGVWAFQCRERDLFHVCDWSCIVEIEKDGRPAMAGEVGEILITALYKRARPLIRYRIGDLATASDRPCRCGRHTHTMGDVLGRVTDIVTTRSGMHISFAVFVGFIEFAPGIAAFQIVQNDVDSLDMFIVKSPKFTDAEMQGILEKIRAGCRGELALRVHYVSEIPRTSSGKRRQVISKVGFSGHGEVLHV
jgi:phenylacetate-CoA ligase